MFKKPILPTAALIALCCQPLGCGNYEEVDNPTNLTSEDPAADFRTVKEQILTADDGTYIYVRTRVGTGDKVVIGIPGGPGISSQYLERGLPPLVGPEYTVVTYDVRGTIPRSSKSPINDYSMEACIADIEMIRIATGVEQVYLFGHSAASHVVFQYAMAHPNRIAGLMTWGGDAPTDTVVAMAQENFVARMTELMTAGILTAAIPNVASPLDDQFNQIYAFLGNFFLDPTWPYIYLPDSFDNLVFPIDTGMALTATWYPPTYDWTPQLATINVPVAAFDGEGDAYDTGTLGTGFSSGAIAAAFPNGEQIIVPGCGHFWEENWADSKVAVQDWLGSL
jgi:pimeloyl-ACP methyl ester carboxylesterase